MWAVEQLKAGKKVTSKKLNVPYLDLGFDGICNHKAMRYHTDIELFEATDWEVFEEKKTLSDKIFQNRLEERDVKQALKEFIEEYTGETLNIAKVQSELYRFAEKHFGKELIE